MDIKETKEAAVALAALITGGIAANADGKVSAFEAMALLGSNAGKLLAAAKGIGEIPSELKDLQPYEFEELYLTLVDAMGLENDADARFKVGTIYDLLAQVLGTLRAFLPAKAEVVA